MLLATDNNPANDDKQRGAGRSNDEANEKQPSRRGKIAADGEIGRAQATEGREQRESEQITEVYEYMTGETAMTEMKNDEVARDKEIALIVIEKQEEVREAEEERLSGSDGRGGKKM